MTHIVPERVVGVPAQPVAVAPISNIKFEISGTAVTLYETPEFANNVDIFETFDLARSAAVQAFQKQKANILAAIARTEKELLAIQGPTTVAAQSVAPVAAAQNIAPTPVAINSPAIGSTPVA